MILTMYWINTVSRDHVMAGVDGEFTQATHGQPTALKRLSRGDFLAFYSPHTQVRDGEALQNFTAIGRIADEEPYQVEMSPDFHPWRRRVLFFNSQEASIRPLIEKLVFIENKKYWGYYFRRGLFEVSHSDFECIAEAMNVRISDEL